MQIYSGWREGRLSAIGCRGATSCLPVPANTLNLPPSPTFFQQRCATIWALDLSPAKLALRPEGLAAPGARQNQAGSWRNGSWLFSFSTDATNVEPGSNAQKRQQDGEQLKGHQPPSGHGRFHGARWWCGGCL